MTSARLPNPVIVIVAGCLIALLGFGARSAFGLFLEPMTLARGWDRETFSVAMALQNLAWGIGVPLASMLADRYGPTRVLGGGALVYALGILGMASFDSVAALYVFGGLLTGSGIALTSFSIALAAMAKAVDERRQSFILGVGTASSSLGQVIFSPVTQLFIANYGWSSALIALAATAVLILPLALLLPGVTNGTRPHEADQSIREAIEEALKHRGYLLLTIGFFVCGFHVAFITVHFPSYVSDLGLPAHVGALSLSLIGLFNILGAFLSGVAGARFSKKLGLATIYAVRALVITLLMLAPKTPTTIYLFAACMGVLWLSTVPLTSGIVAQVFGVRYMATLFGIVFFSHQLGSFSGIWLGGFLYDRTGSYDIVWWSGVALSIAAMLIHLPIDERPLARPKPTTRQFA
ncbi:MAG: MFS transporter [Pseudomonadota bacterium]